jgi:histidine ammonia-lyase
LKALLERGEIAYGIKPDSGEQDKIISREKLMLQRNIVVSHAAEWAIPSMRNRTSMLIRANILREVLESGYRLTHQPDS